MLPCPSPTRGRDPNGCPGGEVANPANPPSGCYFHPRCRYAEEICSQESPVLRELGDEHYVACHLADELQLTGLKTTAALD